MSKGESEYPPPLAHSRVVTPSLHLLICWNSRVRATAYHAKKGPGGSREEERKEGRKEGREEGREVHAFIF